MYFAVYETCMFVGMIVAVVLITRGALRSMDTKADAFAEAGYWRGWRVGWDQAIEWSRKYGVPPPGGVVEPEPLSEGISVEAGQEFDFRAERCAHCGANPVDLDTGSNICGPCAIMLRESENRF